MKVAVWDTYVVRTNGNRMHFDIVVSENEKNKNKIYQFGQEYLNDKNVTSKILTSKECEFCHIENATEQMNKNIKSKGFHIIEMENCD